MRFIRNFKTELHMGAGDNSLALCYKLHQSLDEALQLLSALQQPPDPTFPISKVDELERADMEWTLEGIAQDIFCALTGTEARK